MYVKVMNESGKVLDVDVAPDSPQRFYCTNVAALDAVAKGKVMHTKCACCDKKLVVMPFDTKVYPDTVEAYLKGGRPH